MADRRWRRDEAGATTVEYGLLAALIGLVFLAAGPELLDAMKGLMGAILGDMVGGG